MVVNLLGAVATTTSLILWFPQAAKTWQYRNQPDKLAGISPTTNLLLLTNAILWIAYAAYTQAWWSGAASLVNIPIALLTLHILHRQKV